MKMMTNITFILTRHNESMVNMPCIDSIRAQKNPLWKMIVFNNGKSPDPLSYDDSRITYIESDRDTGAWGTANRQYAIDHLVDTPYIVNTSVQDYYLPCTVDLINEYAAQGVDLIHWQAINHLFRYSVLNGEIAWGQVDWGQFAIKTNIIPSEFCSDWFTLQACLQSGLVNNIHKIDKILTIHN
jgi:glycosyltransferase involved in cell wall biosynthesis